MTYRFQTVVLNATENRMARTFEAKVFARDARRARISDHELCRVIAKARAGQFAADLGGGVIKARLNKNEHRSIILMKGGDLWFYEYLFAKKDRENIEADELAAFKLLVGGYGKLTKRQLKALIDDGDLVEICKAGEEDDDDDDETSPD